VGFIDKSGKISIVLKYDEIGNFSEGKVSVKLSNYNDDQDEWAYIDSKDNIVIDFYPYDAIPAYIYTDDAMKIKKYGLMGLTGNQRLEPIFDYISGI
jgi:hypothetical protein